jgi:hypothetical protein
MFRGIRVSSFMQGRVLFCDAPSHAEMSSVFTRLLKVEVCFPDMRVARHWKFDVFVFFFCSPCTFFVARPLWSRFAFQIIYVCVTYYFDELAFRHIHGNSSSRISPYTSRVRAFVLVLLWQLCRSSQTQSKQDIHDSFKFLLVSPTVLVNVHFPASPNDPSLPLHHGSPALSPRTCAKKSEIRSGLYSNYALTLGRMHSVKSAMLTSDAKYGMCIIHRNVLATLQFWAFYRVLRWRYEYLVSVPGPLDASFWV